MTDLRVAFWNVESLFEPGAVADRGPQTGAEYHAKLSAVSAIVNAFFEGAGPDVLGLAELGTEAVLRALLADLDGDYHYVWAAPGLPKDSGLALVARKQVVAEMTLDKEDVQRPVTLARPRCIVAKCRLAGRDEPLLVTVNHWKSELWTPGVSPPEDRKETARWLANRLRVEGKDVAVIAMGDFNAEPFEAPFREVGLRATRHFSTARYSKSDQDAYLYNTAWRFLAEPDHWEVRREDDYVEPRPKTTFSGSPPKVFDQLLVSRRALERGPLELVETTVGYYRDDVNCHQSRTGVLRPRKWEWQGPGQHQGVSDHFPLTAEFRLP